MARFDGFTLADSCIIILFLSREMSIYDDGRDDDISEIPYLTLPIVSQQENSPKIEK